ncbi:MAG: hypothetical protein CVV49_13660 [Spirochaetae bacterium HGW-Spirochaetae-5]|nr:MAG: hypothetical protein CVV49_13660 [Spirochaetae bacterium HGW-Spirochaetae-5]
MMIKKITKLTRIAIISFIVLVAFIAASVSLIYYFYPEESVKQIIKSRAETLLDRKIEIGSLNYSLKGIVIHDVIIYDKTADNIESVLVKSDEVVITFSILSIINRDFKLRTIYFKGLELNCVFDNNGISNIEHLISELKLKSGNTTGESSVQLAEVILDECRIKIINPPVIVKPLEGEYHFTSTILFNDNSTFSVIDTKVILPQNRGILYPELKVETAGKFIARGEVKLENASLLWVYKFADNDPGLPFDVINGQINNLEINENHIKGDAVATSTLKKTKSILSANGSCIVDINKYTVLLKDIKGRINTSSVTVDDMLISTEEGAIKRFSFTNISFQLSDLKSLLDDLPAGLYGSAKGSLSFDGNSYSGKIDGSGIGFKTTTEIFSNLSTTIDINKNIIRKENVPVKIFGSDSTVSIATTDNKFKNFYISINSGKININDIKFDENFKTGGKTDIPVNITGKINVSELIYDDLIFSNTRANITASGNTIKINNAATSILSGSVNGTGIIDFSDSNPAVQASLGFNNIKIHDIKFKNEKLNKRLFGFADGTVNLGLLIKPNAAETIKGNMTFTVTKGKVVDTGVQDGLIVFLSELRYKLKDLEFNKIYGNININGSNFNINSFIFNSEDIRLTMSGRINKELSAENVNMKLEFNNHFIKDLPRPAMTVFNKYLSGKWYVIPFSLNGNITESKNMKMLDN